MLSSPIPPFLVTDLAILQRERIPQELDGVPRRECRPEIPRRRVPGAGMKGNHPRGAPREPQPRTCTGGEAEGYCSPVSNNDARGSDHQICLLQAVNQSSSSRGPESDTRNQVSPSGISPSLKTWVLIVSDLDPCRRVTRWYRTMERSRNPLGVLSEFWVCARVCGCGICRVLFCMKEEFLYLLVWVGVCVSCTLCPNERQVRLERNKVTVVCVSKIQCTRPWTLWPPPLSAVSDPPAAGNTAPQIHFGGVWGVGRPPSPFVPPFSVHLMCDARH